MAVLSQAQVSAYAQQAGFRGNALNIAVAIARAESGYNATITHLNSDGTTDYGLWQINSVHSQYSPTLLLSSPLYNAQAAYAISGGGVNFTDWTTYKSGEYKQYLTSSSNIPLPSSGTPPVSIGIPEWCKPFMAQPVQWWEQHSNHYPTSSEGWAEGGVDWTPTTPGTPITALLSGTIIGAGYFCKNPSNFFAQSPQTCGGSVTGYGVVTIRSVNPYPNIVSGSLIDIYYQHIIIDPSVTLSNKGGVGQQVAAGQVIGKSNPSFNIEVGVNIGSSWGGIWGTNSPGPHVDPIPFLYTLISRGVPTSGSNISGGLLSFGISLPQLPSGFGYQDTLQYYQALGNSVHQTLITHPGFYGIALAVDEAEQFPGYIDLTDPNNPGPLPDFVGLVRSVGATITDNCVPFVIRSYLIIAGFILLFALVIKPVLGTIETVSGLGE